jgi:hypothetical protein
MELTVLSKGSVWGVIGLVYSLRSRNSFAPQLIMTFVYQRGSVILESILVRSTGPKGHKDYSVITPRAKFMPPWRLVPSREHISK